MSARDIDDAFLALAVESANDAIIITSPELEAPGPLIEYVNPAFTAMTGYSFDEVKGRSPRILQGPRTDRILLDRLRHDLATTQSFFGRTVNYRKDGSEYFVEWRINPVRDTAGNVLRWVAVQRDISDRLLLSETRERLAAIVENSDDAIVSKNLDGEITSWNPGAERLFGYSASEIIGRNIRQLLPTDRLEEEDAIISRIRRGERVEHFETVRMTKEGRAIEVSVTISPIKNENGGVIGASKIARDITERRLTEKALRKAKEAAESANAERLILLEAERSARSEAERASRMKDEFLATLSHELRTPLNSILGWASLLSSGRIQGSELQQGLDTIERNSRVQAQIIEDLLDMSRIISGKVRLNIQPVDIISVFHEAVETVRSAAQAKSVHIEISTTLISSQTTGDPARLQQIFWNILNNAIKFTPREGRIRARIGQVRSHIEIGVSDTGEGIAAEMLPHIFDRFRQADSSTTRRHGGLGLGLSIVKQLVELHGGNVQVHSEGLGQGSTFTISLPIAAVYQTHYSDDTPQHTPRHMTDPPGEGSLNGVRALVVDDEPDARSLVKRLLELSGALVTAVGSAAQALDQVNTRPFDVIVCDIGMPREDGYSLLRRIRALPDRDRNSIPAIALTAYARREDRAEAVRSGFQAHLAKPTEPSELVALIASLAHREMNRLSA